MAFGWRADDGPHIVLNKKTNSKKNTSELKKKIWTPSDKTFGIRAWSSQAQYSVSLDLDLDCLTL